MRKETGLYFGSFNPIHVGHLIIAQHVLNVTELQEVWFVLSPQNPFKPSQTLLNEYHRLHLIRLAIEQEPRLKVSDVEFHLPRPSYTSTTLAYLGEKYPERCFSIIMGSDSFRNLPHWHNSPFILDNYGIYVYERPGFPYEAWTKKATLLQAPVLDISASYVRQLVREKKSIAFLVPQAVREEIEKSNYYAG